jgi:hypothetical protein
MRSRDGWPLNLGLASKVATRINCTRVYVCTSLAINLASTVSFECLLSVFSKHVASKVVHVETGPSDSVESVLGLVAL